MRAGLADGTPWNGHGKIAATLHQPGIEHEAFSFKFQGLDAKLSGVEGAKVIKDIRARRGRREL
jgi:hypothetical protein